ncbi:YkgJ family cysteine cluster protein [Helicobacter sp. T3_23-1059]
MELEKTQKLKRSQDTKALNSSQKTKALENAQGKLESFECTKCGACCKSIAHIDELSDYHSGDGVCKHLDLATNECKIYEVRPLVCRVDEMFEKYFSSVLSKAEFYKLNAKCCNILQEQQGISENFRINITNT